MYLNIIIGNNFNVLPTMLIICLQWLHNEKQNKLNTSY